MIRMLVLRVYWELCQEIWLEVLPTPGIKKNLIRLGKSA